MALVSPTNDDVGIINQLIYDRNKEKERIYFSIDQPVDKETDVQASVFNAMTSPSLPLHALKVKVGCVLMIIRNLCTPRVVR